MENHLPPTQFTAPRVSIKNWCCTGTTRWLSTVCGSATVSGALSPAPKDMTTAYHDYGFHIRGSVKGMLIGPQVCLLVGGLTALLAVIWPPSILL